MKISVYNSETKVTETKDFFEFDVQALKHKIMYEEDGYLEVEFEVEGRAWDDDVKLLFVQGE